MSNDGTTKGTAPAAQTAPAPVQAPAKPKKAWADMTQDERRAEQKARLAGAVACIKGGHFPKAIDASTFAAALQGMILAPVGSTEKGSVSYNLAPTIITLSNGRKARVNKFSVSILPEGGLGDMADLKDAESW